MPPIAQTVFACPKNECRSYFIAYYRAEPPNATFDHCAPLTFQDRDFGKHITEVSKAFVKIFNQAAHAESLGLEEICGVGYRKSLEFLVKDYAKHVQPPEAHAGIEKVLLGTCIENYIKDANIKEVAKRAAWLPEADRSRRLTAW